MDGSDGSMTPPCQVVAKMKLEEAQHSWRFEHLHFQQSQNK